MTGLTRGLIVAGIHAGFLLSIGGKLLVDRTIYPRVWMLARPYDPNLPIRGRYVRLTLENPTGQRYNEPVAFFIPEHVPDPSQRRPGEELWAEVTVPRTGPPRPIRLGVKRNGELTPLPLD